MYDRKNDRFVNFNSSNAVLVTPDGRRKPLPNFYSVKSIRESNDGKHH